MKEDIKKKVAMWSGLIIIFLIPIGLFLYNKFVDKPSPLLTSISNKESSTILVTEYNCKYCNMIKNELDKKNIDYYELSKENKDEYKNAFRLLDLDSRYVEPPSLIIVIEGKTYSYLTDITNKKDLNEYLKNYKLNESE
jgi:glutaredoxin